jgi:hypothetical protein
MILREVALIGTASPRPTPATAVLIPTTWPRESARAPPELPGLSAASVWITSSTIRVAVWVRTGSARPGPLTMPAVTLPAIPRGVADGNHEAADPEVVDVAIDRRIDDRLVGADHGEIGQRVAADDLQAGLAAVGERGFAAVRAANHVGVGE